MNPERVRAYAKAVLVPVVTAAVVAWNEHRSSQNKERQDAAYAVTAPALREMQDEQVRLAARVDVLTQLMATHITQHAALSAPAHPYPPGSRRLGYGSAGLGGVGVAGAGSVRAPGQDQIEVANKLKQAPSLRPVKRDIPASPDEALFQMKR